MMNACASRRLLTLSLAAALACAAPEAAAAQDVTRVIHISVDGLRPDAVEALGPALCPSFHRLMVEGAFTLNARTDCDFTNTLPNHTCQLTGRHVLGPDGHGISFNSDTSATIEEIHGSYVAGIFDVVHDNGYETALFTGKGKFDIFDRSWDSTSGAPDTTGEDDGRDKIDDYLYLWNTPDLVDSFLSLLDSSSSGYFFLHLRDPDSDGHAYGWESPEYLQTVVRMDGLLGGVISAVESDPALASSTALIVTADHGGTGTDHSDPYDPDNYTIQFQVWGPSVPAGADIYALNPSNRADPDLSQPVCGDPLPPVRNGEAANVAASLLGLTPVEGSTIGRAHGLTVTAAAPLPVVAMISPAGGSVFGPGDSVLVEAEASSAAGISKVEFFIDWARAGEDTEPPYELVIDELPLGLHEIAVRALDGDGYAETALVRVEAVSVAASETAETGRWDKPRVYPNPAGSSPRLYLYTSAPGPVQLTLYDVAGRPAGRQRLYSPSRGFNILELDMKGYSSGVYFFTAVSGAGTASGKFILVR
jgi:hypothetical protein